MISANTVIEKMNTSRLSPYKCIRNKIKPCHKEGQGQPRFIICANLVGPTYPMLHIKFQGHGLLVPEKKIFKEFLPYMGVVAHLSHVTRSIYINFG